MSALPARKERFEMLREAIRQRFPHALPNYDDPTAPKANGTPPSAPDLWRGLFPRGRLEGGMHVLVRGTLSSGMTSLALTLACRSAARGERVAWIDGAGRFYPPVAADGGMDLSQLLVCRPRSFLDAMQAAVPLLDCGGFGLVVLDLLELAAHETKGLGRRDDEGDGPLVVAGRRLLLSLRGARGALLVLSEEHRPLPIPPMFEIVVEGASKGSPSRKTPREAASLTRLSCTLCSHGRTGATGPVLHGVFGTEEAR